MQKNLRFFQVGGAVLMCLFLIGVVAETGGFSLAVAAEAGEKGQMEKDKGKRDCKPGPACVSHTPPLPNDKAVDGSACTTGRVCNSPGAVCGLNSTGKCQTTQLGGGNCTCQCIMQ